MDPRRLWFEFKWVDVQGTRGFHEEGIQASDGRWSFQRLVAGICFWSTANPSWKLDNSVGRDQNFTTDQLMRIEQGDRFDRSRNHSESNHHWLPQWFFPTWRFPTRSYSSGKTLWESYNHRLSPDEGIIFSFFFAFCFSLFFHVSDHSPIMSCEIVIFIFFHSPVMCKCHSLFFIMLPSCAVIIFIFFAFCHHVSFSCSIENESKQNQKHKR